MILCWQKNDLIKKRDCKLYFHESENGSRWYAIKSETKTLLKQVEEDIG
jgi:hypothetical protein